MRAAIRRIALAAAVLGVAAVIGLAGCLWWLTTAMRVPGPLEEARAIVIPHGGTDQLAEDLAADGLVSQPLVFRAAVWLTRGEGTLHAAEFAFPEHASIDQVLTILRSAKPVERHVTIAEGLTARQIQAVLAHAEAMAGELPPV